MEISGLINLVVVMQGVQTLLVAICLFYFYYTYRKHYLLLWAWSWLCNSVFFFGGLITFALSAYVPNEHPLRVTTALFYLSAGFLQVPLLLLGAYELASEKIARKITFRLWLLAAVAFTFLLVFGTLYIESGSLRFFLRIGSHSLVSGVAFLIGAYCIFRVWSAGRKPGKMIALTGFTVYGAYQILYTILTIVNAETARQSYLLLYYVLIETMLQFWTALGLVVWLLEDERHQATGAQNALGESERKFRKVLENSLDVIYQFNLETKNFEYMSPAAKELSGYEPEDFIEGGFSFSNSLVHPEDLKSIQKSVKEALASTGEKNTEHSIEYRLRTKHRGYRWVSEHRAVIRDSNHKPLAFIATARDITDQKQIEETLRLQKTLLEAKSETSLDGVLIVGTAEEILLYNRRFIEIWEISEEILESASSEAAIDALIGKLVEPAKFLATTAYLSRHPFIKDQLEIALQDGRVVELYTAPVVGASDTYYGRIWYFRDITERRWAEESVRRSEEKYRTILESIEEGYYEVDLAGSYTFFNRALCESLGYDPEEMPGMNYRQYTDQKTAHKLSVLFNKIYTSGEPLPQVVYEVVRKDGERRIHETSGSLIVDEAGTPLGFRGLLRDITERKRAEENLVESEKRYRFMAEAMPQQVWTAEADGRIDYVNKLCTDYFGYRSLEELSIDWLDVVHPDDLPLCLEKWKISMQSGEPFEVEFRLRRADGVYQWHLGRASAMRDENGQIIKWIGANTNIDELKKAEETLLATEMRLLQSQKLESVGRLAGGIAHDFNNMLTAINGYSDLILRKLDENSTLRAQVVEIKKAGERSASLTNQLLAFSRQQMLQPKLLSLNEVISDTAKMLKRLIGEHIRLNISLSPDLEPIKADPGQLTQVIMNLAVNARDAMPEGGILTLETSDSVSNKTGAAFDAPDEPGNYVLLSVTDSGSGMDKETLQHIFDPFFTTKEVGRGTGLGLATVYGIVKQSGGQIRVDSEIGRGTTFKIYLPTAERVERTIEEIDSAEEFPLGSGTIMLVEDEEMVREMTRQILESCGYQVILARNGVEALELCSAPGCEIDLLMTDVVMPEMGGRELTERLAQTRPQLRVLFTSGYTDDAAMLSGIRTAGANFIQKPYAPEKLAHKVREMLCAPEK